MATTEGPPRRETPAAAKTKRSRKAAESGRKRQPTRRRRPGEAGPEAGQRARRKARAAAARRRAHAAKRREKAAQPVGEPTWGGRALYLLPLAFMGLAVGFWFWAARLERDQIERLSESEAEHVAAEIARQLQGHANTSARSAARWLLRNPRDQADWDAEVFNRNWLDPELLSLEWISPDTTLLWQASEATEALAPRLVEQEALDLAVAEHRVVVSGPSFNRGVPVSIVSAPIERGTALAGWVIAVYDLEQILQTTLEGVSEGFAIEIVGGEVDLYTRYPEQTDLRDEWGHTVETGFDQLVLRAAVWPNAVTLESFRSTLPRLVLIGGLLGALVLALAIRLAKVSSLRFGEAQAYATLQAEVRARKRAERSLERKLNELARSNREFERFAYVVSHDLRDPLNAIALNLQAVLSASAGELDPEDRGRLERGSSAVWRLEQMIDRLLQYASAGGGGGDNLELVDTVELVEEVAANLQASIEGSDAIIACGELPRVIARRSQLTRLLQNLISNALKYGAGRRTRVKIDARKGEDEWIFSVADNGRGMTEEQKGRAFELFWRPRELGDTVGTGIGLAVCQRIVELHGGRVWIDSTPGQGTTVFFTLPADPDTVLPELEEATA